MPAFSNHLLTESGQALIAQAHLGRKLVFTKIAVGSGNVTTPINATALAAHRMDVGITSIQRDATNANWVRVRGMFTNVSLTTGFNYREMGLFARIDSEPEVLYSYVADAGAGDLIPAYDGANPVIVYPTMIVIIESTIPIHADIVIGADFECENIGAANVGPGWYAGRSGNTFEFRRAVAGPGIELAQDNGTVTIAQKILQIDLDLYVPINHPNAPRPEVAFPTIQQALNYLDPITIPSDRTARINIAAGELQHSEPIVVRHPNASSLEIIGASATEYSFSDSANQAVNGTVPNRNMVYNISGVSSAGLMVGDWLGIRGDGMAVGSTIWPAMQGGFQITSVAGTTIGLRARINAGVGLPATGIGLFGTARKIPSVLRFTGTNGFSIKHGMLKALRNIVLVGDNQTGYGIEAADNCGILNLGPDVIITDWDHGIRLDAMQALVSGEGVIIQGARSYGALAQFSSSSIRLRDSYFMGCVNGIGIANGSTGDFYNSVACNNVEYGIANAQGYVWCPWVLACNNGGAGVGSWLMGDIEAPAARAFGNTVDFQVQRGGRINASGYAAVSGFTISFNPTPNTLSASGIIYT